MTPGELYTYLELQKVLADRIHELIAISIPIWQEELEKAKTKWKKEFSNSKRYPDAIDIIQHCDKVFGIPKNPKNIVDVQYDLNTSLLKGVMAKKKFNIYIESINEDDENVYEFRRTFKFWILPMDVESFLIKDPSDRVRKVAKKQIKLHHNSFKKRYMNKE